MVQYNIIYEDNSTLRNYCSNNPTSGTTLFQMLPPPLLPPNPRPFTSSLLPYSSFLQTPSPLLSHSLFSSPPFPMPTDPITSPPPHSLFPLDTDPITSPLPLPPPFSFLQTQTPSPLPLPPPFPFPPTQTPSPIPLPPFPQTQTPSPLLLPPPPHSPFPQTPSPVLLPPPPLHSLRLRPHHLFSASPIPSDSLTSLLTPPPPAPPPPLPHCQFPQNPRYLSART